MRSSSLPTLGQKWWLCCWTRNRLKL